ncbi:MAG: grasp-with-spasm system SPASM domain peptide maturase [Bacteroidota bacterium]
MLVSNCVITKGFTKSTIYDLQYRNFFWISQPLEKCIADKLPENELMYEDSEILQCLYENKLIVAFPKEIELNFPKYCYDYYSPVKIQNAVIEISSSRFDKLRTLVLQLNELGCRNLEIRVYQKCDEQKLIAFLITINDTSIESIDLYLPFHPEIATFVSNIHHKSVRYRICCVHSVPEGTTIDKNNYGIFTNEILEKRISCGNISPFYFKVNPDLFTESQHYNTCLNRKVCIDVNGEIKNCPAMSRSFGNIKDTTIAEAIAKPGFKDLWSIRKDNIDVCKDCEFRYMCTDCRAFIKDPNNIYSQPAKCPYNPYLAKWQGDEGYITVEEWRHQNPDWEKSVERHPLVKKPQKVE